MYRRSYDYTTTLQEREDLINEAQYIIDIDGYFSFANDYPYDMCRDKKVKTDYIVVFYKYINIKVTDLINSALQDWYTVQINSSDNQTIPEIQHLHLIKIIDEN